MTSNGLDPDTQLDAPSPDMARRPRGLSWRSSTQFIVFTIGAGMFSDLFLYSLIVPVVPFLLEDRIKVPQSEVQQRVSELLAVCAGAQFIFSPLVGIFADRMRSRQVPFLFGILALAGSTVLFAVARSMLLLMAARILQGLSGAIVWSIGLAMLVETVGPSKLGTAIGWIFSIITAGPLIAPPLGGMLYRAVGYDGVFGVGVAVLAIDFLLRLLVIERKVAMQYGIVDDEENERVCESLDDTDETPLLERQVEIEEQEFRIAPISSRIVSTVPILACMKNSSLLTAFFLAAVQALFLGAFDATVPTTAERYFGFDSLKSGLLFLPLSAMDLLVGPFAGRLVDRKGSKVVAVVGYSVLVPGHILLRLVQPQADGTDQVALYFCLLACIGIGMGIINAPAVTEASSVVEKYFKFNPTVFGGKSPYAQLYSINSMLFSLGLTVGPVLAGCLTKAINYGNMNAILAGVSALAAVLSYRYLRGGVPKRNHCK